MTCYLYDYSTDLEWKLTYVGSAEDETYDQLLESVLVGPVNVGNYRFVLQVIYAESILTLSVKPELPFIVDQNVIL